MKPESTRENSREHCFGCVYFPPNLPPSGYSLEDYNMLQLKNCSFDFLPQDENCEDTRKTSCSLVELADAEPTL